MSQNKAEKTKRVYIQFAMGLECNPLVAALKATKTDFHWVGAFPFEFYTSQLKNLEILIGLAGMDPVHQVDSIGSVPASVLASFAIREFRPDLVLNAGTCGGFLSSEHRIGEVLLGSQYVAFHGRRIDLPRMREYGIGKYVVASSANLSKHCALRQGIVSTSDALDFSLEDKVYMAENQGTLKEMEAAAIGWVCQFYKAPFLPIKTVTDFVDHGAATAEQFMTNYAVSVENLKTEMLKILNYLGNNPNDPIWNTPV
jgi:5'-methylthioadenosine nucleosidase